MEKVQYYMQCTDKTLVLFVNYRLCITVYTTNYSHVQFG